MMDISKMSDERKSVLLARAMGWEVFVTHDVTVFIPPEGLSAEEHDRGIIGYVDFYDPTNMALAWRAIGVMVDKHTEIWDAFFDWWDLEIDPGHESAQRLWLDKILELAIEAGIIEEE